VLLIACAVVGARTDQQTRTAVPPNHQPPTVEGLHPLSAITLTVAESHHVLWLAASVCTSIQLSLLAETFLTAGASQLGPDSPGMPTTALYMSNITYLSVGSNGSRLAASHLIVRTEGQGAASCLKEGQRFVWIYC